MENLKNLKKAELLQKCVDANYPESEYKNLNVKDLKEYLIKKSSGEKTEPVNQIKKNKKTPKDLVINPKSGDRLKRIRKFR